MIGWLLAHRDGSTAQPLNDFSIRWRDEWLPEGRGELPPLSTRLLSALKGLFWGKFALAKGCKIKSDFCPSKGL